MIIKNMKIFYIFRKITLDMQNFLCYNKLLFYKNIIIEYYVYFLISVYFLQIFAIISVYFNIYFIICF